MSGTGELGKPQGMTINPSTSTGIKNLRSSTARRGHRACELEGPDPAVCSNDDLFPIKILIHWVVEVV